MNFDKQLDVFSRNLSEIRRNGRYSYQAFSEKLRVGKSTVQAIEVGFPYLACAISLVQTEPEYLYQVFKCLYPAVATAFQTSAACVERDIRTLLCAYWRSGGQPLLQAISPRPLTARPTVSELIALLSGYFQDVGDL